MTESGIIVLLFGFSLMFVRPVGGAIRQIADAEMPFGPIVIAVHSSVSPEGRCEEARRGSALADLDPLVRGIAAVAKTYDWA